MSEIKKVSEAEEASTEVLEEVLSSERQVAAQSWRELTVSFFVNLLRETLEPYPVTLECVFVQFLPWVGTTSSHSSNTESMVTPLNIRNRLQPP